MKQNMSVHGGKPMNGIDVSHWNGKSTEPVPEWVRFYGMKAAHIGGSGMWDGIDPLLNYNRERADDARGVRWSTFYLYLVADVPQVDQINKLAEAVGRLNSGESVMIDWEENDVTMLDEEAWTYLNALYQGRWMMYVNDMTPSMTAWMSQNKDSDRVPVMHPNWSDNGWREAVRWKSTVWQAGIGYVPGYKDCIDVDLVLRPDRMDKVCGVETWDLL